MKIFGRENPRWLEVRSVAASPTFQTQKIGTKDTNIVNLSLHVGIEFLIWASLVWILQNTAGYITTIWVPGLFRFHVPLVTAILLKLHPLQIRAVCHPSSSSSSSLYSSSSEKRRVWQVCGVFSSVTVSLKVRRRDHISNHLSSAQPLSSSSSSSSSIYLHFEEWALEYHDPFCILCTNWFDIKSKYGVHSPHICIVIFVDNKWDGREYIFIIIIAIFPTISHQVLNHNHQPSSSLPLPLPLLLLNNIIIIIIFILISLVSCNFPSHAVFPSWQGLQMVEHKLNCIENCRNINTQVLKTRGSTGKHNTHWITVGFLVLSMYCGGVGQVEWW